MMYAKNHHLLYLLQCTVQICLFGILFTLSSTLITNTMILLIFWLAVDEYDV